MIQRYYCNLFLPRLYLNPDSTVHHPFFPKFNLILTIAIQGCFNNAMLNTNVFFVKYLLSVCPIKFLLLLNGTKKAIEHLIWWFTCSLLNLRQQNKIEIKENNSHFITHSKWLLSYKCKRKTHNYMTYVKTLALSLSISLQNV